jgi:hypothetical protein
MTIRDVAARWRAEAELFDRYGDTARALICRTHADDLEAALRDEQDGILTLHEAALASGYSPDRLRHMVAAGRIPNAGRRGAPRIRRGDLPAKGKAPAGGFDPSATARAILRSA